MTATDAGFDLAASIGAHVSGSLGRALEPVAGKLGELTAALRKPPYVPIYSRHVAQDAVDANGNLTLGLGAPPQGTYWNIRQIAVGGSDPSVAPAGVAYVFVLPTDPGPLGLAGTGLADWRDFAPSLPLLAWYSPGDLTLYPPQRLYVMFAGGVAGVLLSAVAQIEQHEHAAVAQVISQ